MKKEKYAKEFEMLAGAQLSVWIKQEFVKSKATVSMPALNFLAQNAGGDMWRLSSLIAQLSAYATGREVGVEGVKLFLDEKDFRLIEGKKVLIVDDVISTGSTLEAMRKLMAMAGATIVDEVAIFTEGDSNEWGGIISLGHLPLFFE